jgi:hypothetical protein
VIVVITRGAIAVVVAILVGGYRRAAFNSPHHCASGLEFARARLAVTLATSRSLGVPPFSGRSGTSVRR